MATKIRGGNIGVTAVNEMEDKIQTRVADPNNVKIRRAITNLVDSDYVTERAGPSTDSATVENIVDSRFSFNPSSISTSVTVDSAENGMVVGPIDLDSGVTITINGTLMVF